MSGHEVRQVVLSTDNLDESIAFYTETLGFALKFRDGSHYAALDGGAITVALATSIDHPLPGKVVVGIRTDDVDGAQAAVEKAGGTISIAPHDYPGGRRFFFREPGGAEFLVYWPSE